ncbi:hypothetical protein WYO_0192 [Methylobacterium sp. GXF4]|uniref:hypothetical protein n=1 Tax=Methylobacterium sp. GXF4 TaxID=1096546 RepID=UPI0002698F58|nr:hypothetical protein [Methylobacterium sp. GXF4]EIZ87155.1 hypothetical protein WYO_0192 [Methylobacterium sp. GXF4]
MALDATADYIRLARINLNDALAPYRYADTTMLEGLQQGVDDMRRLRPDLFIDDPHGTLTVVGPGIDLQVVDRQYRSALLDYLVAYCELTDDEAANNARSTSFRSLFATKLSGGSV